MQSKQRAICGTTKDAIAKESSSRIKFINQKNKIS